MASRKIGPHIQDDADPQQVLLSAMRQVAARESLQVVESPSELNQASSRSQYVAGELGLPPRPASEHPSFQTNGIFVDHYAILVASLGTECSLTKVYQRIAYYHRRAAVCLSWLSTSFKSDLNLFLIGPGGSSVASDWFGLAARIERDESVCRKMVWLPPTDRDQLSESALVFLERTFLARPWKLLTRTKAPDLSPVNRLGSEDPVLRAWLSVMEGEIDDPGESLVDRLIDAWKGTIGESSDVS